jgi:hypothetical protein
VGIRWYGDEFAIGPHHGSTGASVPLVDLLDHRVGSPPATAVFDCEDMAPDTNMQRFGEPPTVAVHRSWDDRRQFADTQ